MNAISLGGNASRHQLVAHVFVNGEPLTAGRHGEIAEHQLRRALGRRLAPDAFDLGDGLVDLAVGMIGQTRAMEPQIEGGLPTIRRHQEHVVLTRVHLAGPQGVGALDQ